MSAADAVARMLTLVPWLIERPGASLTEIADAFGVSERRVRRDLQHLDFCGLPGLGGGALFDVTIVGDRVVVSMADELRRPLRLTPREALRLLLTLTTVEQAFGDELPALRSAIDKVRAAADLPRPGAVTVDTAVTDAIGPIRDALARDRRLRLRYQGRSDNAPRDRLVDPWQLDVTPDGWYLHAHDVEAAGHRTFRLDRIASVEVLDLAREAPPPTEPLPTPTYHPGPDAVEVELVLAPPARWIAETVVCDEDEETDAGRRVVFATDALPWVARTVLMASGSATIRRPPALRDLVRQLARDTLESYRHRRED